MNATSTTTGSTTDDDSDQDDDLKPLGLCRWKLQQLLQERVAADPAIFIHHGAAVVGAEMMDDNDNDNNNNNKRVCIHLVDGQIRYAAVLFLDATGPNQRFDAF